MVSAAQKSINRQHWNENVNAVWATANAMACWQALVNAVACNADPPISPAAAADFANQTFSTARATLKSKGALLANVLNSVGAACAVILPGSGMEVPVGLISMYSGTLASIAGLSPGTWHLCDGTMGTPDLRSKFVRGAPPATEPGSTGGSDTQSHGSGTLAADAASAGTPSGTNTGTAVSAHSGTDVTPHSGTAVSAHSGTAVSAHSGSAVADHPATATGAPSATTTAQTPVTPVTLASSGHTHLTPVLAHSVTQPADHVVTQPDNHTVTQPDNHGVTQPIPHIVTDPAFAGDAMAPHPHTISGLTADADNRPAFYELLYIQRVA